MSDDIAVAARRPAWHTPAITRIDLAQTRGAGNSGGDGASQNGHG